MVNWTDWDLTYAAHAAKAAHANREGWLRQGPGPAPGTGPRQGAATPSSVGRQAGEAIVRFGRTALRAGERLRRTRPNHASGLIR